MNQETVQAAAEFLAKRRLNHQITPRLPAELRPQNSEQGWLIQQAQTILLTADNQNTIGGWKCSLPFDDKLVVAPILASTIYTQSPCPIQLEDGICKIEPEIGFRLKRDLPARTEAYRESEIIEALEGAYLALEFIQNRYLSDEKASFFEHLADYLFNQGAYIGQSIPLEKAFTAEEIDFTLSQKPEPKKVIKGKHPNGTPQAPLFWLVNYLSQQGIDLKAGQTVITGSYAGVFEVLPQQPFSLEYQGLGELNLRFDGQ